MANFNSSQELASEARNEVEKEALLDVYKLYGHLVKRTYEYPIRWYYLVFKPFNSSYDEVMYSRPLGPISDYLRSRGCDLQILSREIVAPKIHVNALVTSLTDLTELNGKNITKRGLGFKLHVQHVPTLADRLEVFSYMFKEAEKRPFLLFVDHLCKSHSKSYVSQPVDISDDPDERPFPCRRLLSQK